MQPIDAGHDKFEVRGILHKVLVGAEEPELRIADLNEEPRFIGGCAVGAKEQAENKQKKAGRHCAGNVCGMN
jgi:hypothetical protein